MWTELVKLFGFTSQILFSKIRASVQVYPQILVIKFSERWDLFQQIQGIYFEMVRSSAACMLWWDHHQDGMTTSWNGSCSNGGSISWAVEHWPGCYNLMLICETKTGFFTLGFFPVCEMPLKDMMDTWRYLLVVYFARVLWDGVLFVDLLFLALVLVLQSVHGYSETWSYLFS